MSRTRDRVRVEQPRLAFSLLCVRDWVVRIRETGWERVDLSSSRLKSDGRWRAETLAFQVELGTELRVSPRRFPCLVSDFSSSLSLPLCFLLASRVYFFRGFRRRLAVPTERHESSDVSLLWHVSVIPAALLARLVDRLFTVWLTGYLNSTLSLRTNIYGIYRRIFWCNHALKI